MSWPRQTVQVFRAVAPVGDEVHDGQALGRAVLLWPHDGAVLAVVAEPGGARSREGVVAGGGVGLARVAQVAAVACRVGHHTESEQGKCGLHSLCRVGHHTESEQGKCGLHSLCRVGHHTESEQSVCRQGRKYEQGNCGLIFFVSCWSSR